MSGLPVPALLSFGAYAAAMFWYAVPGGGNLPAGPQSPPEWIRDLSLVGNPTLKSLHHLTPITGTKP